MVIFYGSPLSKIIQVLRTRSSVSLHPPLQLMVLVNRWAGGAGESMGQPPLLRAAASCSDAWGALRTCVLAWALCRPSLPTLHSPPPLPPRLDSPSALWAVYGAAIQNWFICVPNAMGACLGGTSCLLCLIFPRIPTEEGKKALERRLTRLQTESHMLATQLKRMQVVTKGKDRHRVAAERTQWAQEAVAEWEEEEAADAEWEAAAAAEAAAAKARYGLDDSAGDEAEDDDVETGGAAAAANGKANDRAIGASTSPVSKSDGGDSGADEERWHDAV